MQPIDYMQGYKNPLQNILDQVKMYQEFNQNANILRSQKAQSQLEQATNERKIRAMQDLHNLDFDDESLLKKYVQEYKDLEYSKGIQDHLASLDEKQKQAEIGRISQTLSLLKNGKKDVAIDDLLAQAQAFENAGDSKNAEGARKMAQLIYQDPNSALDLVGKSYAVMVGKDGMNAYKDYITTTAPNVQYQNMGGYGKVIKTDPITGDVTTKNVGNITQSPDNVADNETKIAVAQGGWQNAKDVANINNIGAMERTQLTTQADVAITEAKLAYEAQQDKFKNAQQMFDENGNVFYYNPATGEAEYAIDPQGKPVSRGQVEKKELSNAKLKNIQESEEQILSAQNMVSKLNYAIANLTDGTLNLGLLNNIWNAGKQKSGYGNDKSSRAYADLTSTVNEAVNQVLMLAKGTQTEGDAQRAKETILSMPMRDNATVVSQLQKLLLLADKTIKLKKEQIQRVYGNAGGSEMQEDVANIQSAYNAMYGK